LPDSDQTASGSGGDAMNERERVDNLPRQMG